MTDPAHNPGGVNRRAVLATVPAAAAAALTITAFAPAEAVSAAEPRRPECLADLAAPSREDR